MPHGIAFLRRQIVVLCIALPWLTGCAAFHPMRGVPVRYLPDELKVGHRNGQRTIDLSLLRQDWNGIHLVDSGDVLGIYIGGVLGKIDENPQVQIPQNSDYQPAAGVPVTVREDGTISLPMVGALLVRGKSIRETEDAIRHAYTNHVDGKEFLSPERERILVSLQRPRQTRVMVVRQDSRNEPMPNAGIGMLNLGTAKRGSGKVVSLPAYRNDILNALIATDGLPGLDAENAVYIIRRLPNATGPDPNWPNGIDPAELIRQSKQAEQPIIRGQNPGGWTVQMDGVGDRGYGEQGFPQGNSAFQRNDRLQSLNSEALQFGQYPAANGNYPMMNGGYSPPSVNGISRGQAAINAQQDPDEAINAQPNAYRNGPASIDRVGYQNAQPWSLQNGVEPMPTGDNPHPTQFSQQMSPPFARQQQTITPYAQQMSAQYPQQPYAPTPYSNPQGQQTPVQQPSMNPTPMAPLQPQPAFPPNPADPNFGTPSFNQPNGSVPLPPVPGYSLQNPSAPLNAGPDDIPMNVQGTDPSGTTVRGIGLTENNRIIRIPIRMLPDERVDIRKEDIILHDGDIVFIEGRDTEVFFTGGLLGGGQYTLPRDFDLDILQALSIASSRSGSGGVARQVGGVSALNSDVTISPSNVVIIRKLPEGGEIPIKVDLYQARNDLSERIVVQPGDYIYLQYTPCEAIAAFIDRHLLEGALFGVFASQLNRPTN